MLDREAKLLARAQSYLEQVLDTDVALRPAPTPAALPYFLHDAYAVAETSLLGRRALILVARAPETTTPSELGRHLDQFARSTPDAIPVLLLPTIDAVQRRQLIANRVPFIVPGNQLYLPQLAVDLRERFPLVSGAASDQAVGRATQALLITALLREPWRPDWPIEQDATRLGYTAMTVTRAVRELEDADLIGVTTTGRKRHVRLKETPARIWERAQPRLRDPVRKEILVSSELGVPEGALLAGQSALSELTSITPPRTSVWAVSAADWRAAHARGAAPLRTREGANAWQVWTYGPGLDIAGRQGGRTVDPLSLMLSLAGEPDERIQMALDELKERLPWRMSMS